MTQGFDGVDFVIVAALFFLGGWILFRKIDKEKEDRHGEGH